eukprot:gene15365-32522_t
MGADSKAAAMPENLAIKNIAIGAILLLGCSWALCGVQSGPSWIARTMRTPPLSSTFMHTPLSEEIAHTTARLVVEEGLEWGPAKRRALRQMGLPARTPLPDNDLVEAAVREYIELFCADTQPRELRALRQLAL